MKDYPNALNGLHLQNDGRVTRIGAAVDASEAIIEMAIVRQVDLLLVHHGLFWGGLARLVGAQFRKLKRAVSANLAIYSAHLPLDLHPEVGNNILLARALKLGGSGTFFSSPRAAPRSCNLDTNWSGRADRSVERGSWPGIMGLPSRPGRSASRRNSDRRRRRQIEKAKAEGIDTFITGEGPHHTFCLGRRTRNESDLWRSLCNGDVRSPGSRGTDRFAVYALPWNFLDHPLGTLNA